MGMQQAEIKTTVHNISSGCLYRCVSIVPFCFRDFLEKYYIGIKKENPQIPILVRECSGIQPKMYARYGKNYTVI